MRRIIAVKQFSSGCADQPDALRFRNVCEAVDFLYCKINGRSGRGVKGLAGNAQLQVP